MRPSRPVYLATEPDPIFAIFHPPAPGSAPGSAVLMCPPWGWDEVASYRSRREWAERLAAAGHPTLRFALPAAGNSIGSPRDPRRVEAWQGAIVGAAAWLRASAGASRVTALGLGLGGLLARAALDAGAPIDELVLWGAPVSGRAFHRETRAFSRMQAWSGTGDERPEESLPEGWIEAGGFVLSAETLESLRKLGPEIDPGPRLRRALLLERDGIAVDAAVRDELEAAGVAVEVAPGPGWADLISHAERTKLSPETADRVAEWLGKEAAGAPRPATVARPAELDGLTMEIDGHGVRERAIEVRLPFGRAIGVLAEPTGEPASDLCAICLNAGAVRSIGPNRIWVETARRWAAGGVRTLRIDLEGIGEADGEEPANVAEFYLPKFEQQIEVVLDQLESEGIGSRFLLAGLCGGGYWAFRSELRDPRVQTALLLNSGALAWDPELIAQREARKVGRASQLHWWGKLLRGEIAVAKLWSFAGSLLVAAGRSLRHRARRLAGRSGEPLARAIEADLDHLRDSGTTLTLAFSEGEPLLEELQAGGLLTHLDRWPNVALRTLPGNDHTLRPVAAQAGARELLDHELRRALEHAGPAPSLP
jgi:hypothetical protein